MNTADLHGHWVHSHEEDSPTEAVYRPASHPFPPARGRDGFELEADGSLVEHGIGPTDRSTKTAGKWALDAGVLTMGGRARKIVSLAPDRLVLRKA